ncbi:MAG: helix-hairpin-helix domain-containing protein [Saprospiraceae bacterium]
MDIDGLWRFAGGAFLPAWHAEKQWRISIAWIILIATLEGLGKKSADKLRKSIEKAKTNPIHRLLHGLCIHHLGKKISKLIAAHLNDVKDLEHWSLDQYRAIKDVGPVVGQNIMDFRIQVTYA